MLVADTTCDVISAVIKCIIGHDSGPRHLDRTVFRLCSDRRCGITVAGTYTETWNNTVFSSDSDRMGIPVNLFYIGIGIIICIHIV